MVYEVTAQSGQINFAPASTVEEVLQNVRTLLGTTKFSAPLDREFGLKTSLIDRPTPQAQALISADIVQAIRRWEPRAKVEQVTFAGDKEGYLVPKVRVKIEDE